MKKAFVRHLMVLSLIAPCLAACQTTSTSNSNVQSSSKSTPTSSVVTALIITDFPVNEKKVDEVDIGSEYTAGDVLVKFSDESSIKATLVVKDPNGGTVTLNGNKFTCSMLGDYKVSYSVSYNTSDSATKAYIVRVSDVTEPEIETALNEQNICLPGTSFDLSTIKATDNSGESITPNIAVELNGTAINVDGNTITFSEAGVYTIKVHAEDTSHNATDKEFEVYTKLDFEHGKYYNSKWYPTEISEAQAHSGTHGYSFGMFSKAPNYFDDSGMLGDIYLLGDQKPTAVSFWIYWDQSKTGAVNTILTNAIYQKLVGIYDQYGAQQALNWQGKYEMSCDKWYRFVVDPYTLAMTGETASHADAKALTNTLLDLCFYFGAWDQTNNAATSKTIDCYLDDIRLVGTTDDETYAELPHDYPANCIADFESNVQATYFTPSANSTAFISKEQAYNASVGSLKFTPYLSESHLTFGKGLNITDLNGAKSISAEVYAADGTAGVVYDDSTNLKVSLRHDGAVVASNAIKQANAWTKLTFDLGTYNTNALDDGKFDLTVSKSIAGVAVADGAYQNLAVYFDDIYRVPNVEYIAGTYADSAYADIFNGVLAASDGYFVTDLANFTIAHGSETAYTPLKKTTTENQLGPEEGTHMAYAENWKVTYGNNDAILLVAKANKHVFIKSLENSQMSSWIGPGSGSEASFWKVDAAANTTTQLGDVVVPETGKGYLNYGPLELAAGDSFIIKIFCQFDDNRNMSFPPYFSVAEAIIKA